MKHRIRKIRFRKQVKATPRLQFTGTFKRVKYIRYNKTKRRRHPLVSRIIQISHLKTNGKPYKKSPSGWTNYSKQFQRIHLHKGLKLSFKARVLRNRIMYPTNVKPTNQNQPNIHYY